MPAKIITTVLFSLSTSMIICGLTIAAVTARPPRWVWKDVPLFTIAIFAFITIASFGISDAIVHHENRGNGDVFWLLRLLAVPGVQGELSVLYPILPWPGVCAFGCIMGFILTKHPNVLRNASILIAAVFGSTFVLLRSLTDFGSIIPPISRSNGIDFLNVVKYPPSINYALVTVAILHFFLALFITISRMGNPALPPFSHWLWRPCVVFGGCALFYYLGHLWVILIPSLAVDPKVCSVLRATPLVTVIVKITVK